MNLDVYEYNEFVRIYSTFNAPALSKFVHLAYVDFWNSFEVLSNGVY